MDWDAKEDAVNPHGVRRVRLTRQVDWPRYALTATWDRSDLVEMGERRDPPETRRAGSDGGFTIDAKCQL